MSGSDLQPEPSTLPAEAIESSTETYGLPSTAESMVDRIAITRIRARRFLASACRQSVSASKRAVVKLQNRTRRLKDECPVALLGVVAGSAFVLGVTLHIWKSRR